MKPLQLTIRVLLSSLTLILGASAGFGTGDERAPGELFSRDPLEPPPSSFVLDEARLFREHESAQLSARLQDFVSRNDIYVYVAAYSSLIGETVDERATRLKNDWLSAKNGIVVVYERGTEKMSLSPTAGLLDYLSRPVVADLFASAYAQASQMKRGSSNVIAATNQLVATLPIAIQIQEDSDRETKAEAREFVSWAVAGLILLAIAGMVGFHLLHRVESRETITYALPAVKTLQRLGAPYCGGHQAEMDFSVSSP